MPSRGERFCLFVCFFSLFVCKIGFDVVCLFVWLVGCFDFVCVCVCDYKRESAIQRTPLSPTRGTHSIGVVHSFPPSGDVEQSESVQQAKNKMLRSEVKARGILV